MRMKMPIRIAARRSRREGVLSEDQYQTVMGALRHPMRKCKDGSTVNILERIEEYASKEMGRQGWSIDFDTVIQWFKDNWLQILQAIAAIMTIVVLLDPAPIKEPK